MNIVVEHASRLPLHICTGVPHDVHHYAGSTSHHIPQHAEALPATQTTPYHCTPHSSLTRHQVRRGIRHIMHSVVIDGQHHTSPFTKTPAYTIIHLNVASMLHELSTHQTALEHMFALQPHAQVGSLALHVLCSWACPVEPGSPTVPVCTCQQSGCEWIKDQRPRCRLDYWYYLYAAAACP